MTNEELDQKLATLREVNRDQNSLASKALNSGDPTELMRQLVSLAMNTNLTLLGIYSELVAARQAGKKS
jgi:hypothetical protein